MNHLFPWHYDGGGTKYRVVLRVTLLNALNLGIYTLVVAVIWRVAT